MKKFDGFMKGVNLGGWISQFDKFDIEHFDTFITEKDIEDIANIGFDHVRLPVDYVMLEEEDATRKEIGYDYIHKCINWCRTYGLHVLLDLHECYGYSFDPLKKDMDRERFFFDEDLQARFFALWKSIAKEFVEDTDVVALELLNEVVLSSVTEAWNNVARKCVEAIRTVSKDYYIVIGGANYSNVINVEKLDPPYDDRIVYNFHCYEPMIFTHQSAYWVNGMPDDFVMHYPGTLEEYRRKSDMFQRELVAAIYKEDLPEIGPDYFEYIILPAIKAAEKYDVPLYCGEYGVIDRAPLADSIRWLSDIHSIFNKYGIGRALWNYKAKDFGFADSKYPEIREEISKCL